MDSPTSIPMFIEAKNKLALAKAMLKNNVNASAKYIYFDIQQEKSGNWVAWYYKDMDGELKEAINKITRKE